MALARDPKIRFICLNSRTKNKKKILEFDRIIDLTSLDISEK